MWYNSPLLFYNLATRWHSGNYSKGGRMQYRNSLILYVLVGLSLSIMIAISNWKDLPNQFAVVSITLGTSIGVLAIASLFYVAISHKEIIKRLCLLYENWFTFGSFSIYFTIRAVQYHQLFSYDTLIAVLWTALTFVKYLQNLGIIKKEEK